MAEVKKQDRPQIFLSYAHANEHTVEILYNHLSNAGFKPWMDKKDILPSEDWRLSIKRAIQHSDFFIACLSANAIGRRGEIQREIDYGIFWYCR